MRTMHPFSFFGAHLARVIVVVCKAFVTGVMGVTGEYSSCPWRLFFNRSLIGFTVRLRSLQQPRVFRPLGLMEHVSPVAYFVKGIIKYGFAGGLDFSCRIHRHGWPALGQPF